MKDLRIKVKPVEGMPEYVREIWQIPGQSVGLGLERVIWKLRDESRGGSPSVLRRATLLSTIFPRLVYSGLLAARATLQSVYHTWQTARFLLRHFQPFGILTGSRSRS